MKDVLEKLGGYGRYKSPREQTWSGRCRRDILTPERIQVMRFEGTVFEEDFSYIPDLEIPKPPKGISRRRLKKSELEQDVNYIICPDKKCGLFWDDRFRMACEGDCPKKEQMEKMIVCYNCSEPIYLRHDHSTLQNASHSCKDGHSPVMFTRMRGKYPIIYQHPKD